ncbi:hypothetical protein [Blautia massiliensis (ex Durand et al. 2017)]|uniref:hypothetical protein n=1 Tax=Blautia massiliensis (ex Durand et al. 2017) TaxID=1737424 RepID=UPI0039A38D86
METLQGLSAAELSTAAGRRWRTAYSDRITAERRSGQYIWPKAFERMEQFIRDTGLSRADLDMNYDDVAELYKSGKLAMYFGTSAGVKNFQDQGIDTIFLPFLSRTAKSG